MYYISKYHLPYEATMQQSKLEMHSYLVDQGFRVGWSYIDIVSAFCTFGEPFLSSYYGINYYWICKSARSSKQNWNQHFLVKTDIRKQSILVAWLFINNDIPIILLVGPFYVPGYYDSLFINFWRHISLRRYFFSKFFNAFFESLSIMKELFIYPVHNSRSKMGGYMYYLFRKWVPFSN